MAASGPQGSIAAGWKLAVETSGLTKRTKHEHMRYRQSDKEIAMTAYIRDAAALGALMLFIAMIGLWSDLLVAIV
jgi:hypothetical protein